MIKRGDRVNVVGRPKDCGHVTHSDERYVTVHWDDGSVGNLVWDWSHAANAYRLECNNTKPLLELA